jgi:hypothetical protein
VPETHVAEVGPAAAFETAVTSIVLAAVTLPVAVICVSPWMFTLAWYSRSRPAWLMPVPLPFSSMSFLTAWPTVTAPLHAETP